jgi:ADP-ribosylglycohydrolase
LAAAAIAAALDPANGPEDVIEIVLSLAYENNKDVFYELNLAARQSARFRPDDPASDLGWWYHNWGRYDGRRRPNQLADNPLFFVLPLLRPFDGDAQKLFATLLWPEGAWLGANVIINPVLAGALLGARHGRGVFPAEWRVWADTLADPWYEIERVVEKRSRQEARIVGICDTLAQETEDGASLLEERIYGCLLASSIGNAMGSSTECMLYWEIDERYPGGVQTVLNPARLEGEDDNQMAMLLAETYLRRDGKPVMARHFGQTWYDRLNRDHFFPLCMGAAYDLIRAGWDPRITGHWSVVTGSTVMCMEPVGIYHVADPTYAEIDATAISYMYQRGTDVIAAAILAATVAEALLPDATVDSVCEAALRASPRGEWKTFDQRSFASPYAYIETCLAVAEKYDDVMAAREELYQKCLLYHPIDPIELLGLSLAMFLVAQGDVRQAAIGGTNIGRDADTIAGRGAMLAGALNGPGGVPAEWMALFKPESLERIRGNARRLTTLILEKKLSTLKRRRAIAG